MLTDYAISEAIEAVRVGDRIRGEETNARGSIGAILATTRSDDLYAVTSAVVTGNIRDTLVLSDDGEHVLGRVAEIDLAETRDDVLPAWKLLGLIRLEAPVEEDDSQMAFGEAIVEDPLGCLGQSVLRKNGQIHRGRVTAVNMPIHMRAPSSAMTKGYSGLVEVTSEHGSAFADGSTGGQAVYLENGSLLGLIIGGFEDRCFVAPIAGMALRLDLAIANVVNACRHNERVRSRVMVPQSVVERPSPAHATRFDTLDKFMKIISNVSPFYQLSRR